MSTKLVAIEQFNPPAYLQQSGNSFTSILAATLGGSGYPVISTKGNRFTVVRKTERQLITVPGDDDTPAGSLHIVILNANTHLSKTYYAKGWEEGSTEKPDCSSINGITPDSRIDNPVAKSCAVCPKNVWGTGIGGKGKACQDTLRLAVAPAGHINDPMLLRITPGNLKALGEYMQKLDARKIGAEQVVTKIKFGDSPGKLIFEFAGGLSKEQWEEVQKVRSNDLVQRIIGVSEPAPEDEQLTEEVVEKPTTKQSKVEVVEEVEEIKPAPKAAKPKAEKPASSIAADLEALLAGDTDD